MAVPRACKARPYESPSNHLVVGNNLWSLPGRAKRAPTGPPANHAVVGNDRWPFPGRAKRTITPPVGHTVGTPYVIKAGLRL